MRSGICTGYALRWPGLEVGDFERSAIDNRSTPLLSHPDASYSNPQDQIVRG